LNTILACAAPDWQPMPRRIHIAFHAGFNLSVATALSACGGWTRISASSRGIIPFRPPSATAIRTAALTGPRYAGTPSRMTNSSPSRDDKFHLHFPARQPHPHQRGMLFEHLRTLRVRVPSKRLARLDTRVQYSASPCPATHSRPCGTGLRYRPVIRQGRWLRSTSLQHARPADAGAHTETPSLARSAQGPRIRWRAFA